MHRARRAPSVHLQRPINQPTNNPSNLTIQLARPMGNHHRHSHYFFPPLNPGDTHRSPPRNTATSRYRSSRSRTWRRTARCAGRSSICSCSSRRRRRPTRAPASSLALAPFPGAPAPLRSPRRVLPCRGCVCCTVGIFIYLKISLH